MGTIRKRVSTPILTPAVISTAPRKMPVGFQWKSPKDVGANRGSLKSTLLELVNIRS